jgi:hypothetical protein
MARWKPRSEDSVGKNEHVGRRLFDEPMLVGMRDPTRSVSRLDLRHFEETRHREFSLDRLGRSGIEKAVLGYLGPRAVAAGQKFSRSKPFNGWAVIRVKQLESPKKNAQWRHFTLSNCVTYSR